MDGSKHPAIGSNDVNVNTHQNGIKMVNPLDRLMVRLVVTSSLTEAGFNREEDGSKDPAIGSNRTGWLKKKKWLINWIGYWFDWL